MDIFRPTVTVFLLAWTTGLAVVLFFIVELREEIALGLEVLPTVYRTERREN
jgi:hypothetical protein